MPTNDSWQGKCKKAFLTTVSLHLEMMHRQIICCECWMTDMNKFDIFITHPGMYIYSDIMHHHLAQVVMRVLSIYLSLAVHVCTDWRRKICIYASQTSSPSYLMQARRRLRTHDGLSFCAGLGLISTQQQLPMSLANARLLLVNIQTSIRP